MTNSHRSLVLEIIGPAGAGKSTLAKALVQVDTRFHSESLPPVWQVGYAPFFASNILALSPILLRMIGKPGRRLSRRELAWMAILNGWPDLLKKKKPDECPLLLLDQGPVFLLSVLSGFGPPALSQASFQGWWRARYQRWAQALDLLIWLDAADEVLIQRIRGRASDHLIKDQPEPEMHEFLTRFRSLYENTVDHLTAANPSLQVLRLNSGQSPVGELVGQVINHLPLQIRR